MESKTLTIMFADIQGFTSRAATQTREEHQLFLGELKEFIEKHIKDYGGKLVKSMGDGFLITFESPTNAVICGIQLQKDIEKRNANVLNENDFVRFRIGVSTGEVSIDQNGDCFGDAVNIASRIQRFAEPNNVYISETSYLAMNKAEVQVLDLGPQRFKNVLEEIRVYKVLKDEGDFSGISKRFAKKRWLVFVAGWVLLLILIMVYPGPFRQLIKKAIFSISGGPLSKGSDSHGRLKWMEEQLKIDPNNLMLVLRLAGESMAQGDIDKAQAYFRRAEEINPSYQDVLLKYAERFEEDKNYTEALNILELLEFIQKDEQSRQRLAERIDRLLQLRK